MEMCQTIENRLNSGISIIKNHTFKEDLRAQETCDILSERTIFKTTDEIKIPILFKNTSVQTNKKGLMEKLHPRSSCLFLENAIVVFIFLNFFFFFLVILKNVYNGDNCFLFLNV